MCTTFGPRPTLWSHLLLYKGCVNTKWCSSSSSAPPRLITPLELMSCFVYWGHKRHLLLSSKVSLSHTHTYLHTQSDAHRNQCVTLIWIEGCKTQLLITLAWSLRTTHKWSRKNKKKEMNRWSRRALAILLISLPCFTSISCALRGWQLRPMQLTTPRGHQSLILNPSNTRRLGRKRSSGVTQVFTALSINTAAL